MSELTDSILIYLDDIRTPPSRHWLVAKDADIAYAMVREAQKNGKKIILSLDHDLGEGIPTGYDLLNWIEKDIVTDDEFSPDIVFHIHSANPVGCERMAQAIRSIERLML